MLHFKLSLRQLKNHFTYEIWKYVIVLISVIASVSLIFNAAGIGQIPRDKRLMAYFTGTGLRGDYLMTLEYEASLQFPEEELEQLLFQYIPYDSTSVGSNQAISNAMVVTRSGDLYIVDEAFFRQSANSGFLKPLDDYLADESLVLPEGLDLTAGYYKMEGETVNRLYGIPLKDFDGFSSLVGQPTRWMTPAPEEEPTAQQHIPIPYQSDKYLVMVSYTPIPDKALKLMNFLISSLWNER